MKIGSIYRHFEKIKETFLSFVFYELRTLLLRANQSQDDALKFHDKNLSGHAVKIQVMIKMKRKKF